MSELETNTTCEIMFLNISFDDLSSINETYALLL